MEQDNKTKEMTIESDSPEMQNIELSETNFKITMVNMVYKVKDKSERIRELKLFLRTPNGYSRT